MLVAVYHAAASHSVIQLKGVFINVATWEASLVAHGAVATCLGLACLNLFVEIVFFPKPIPKPQFQASSKRERDHL